MVVTLTKNKLSFSGVSLLALTLLLVLPALQSGASQDKPNGPSPAQAIVAYSFLHWGSYPVFDQLLTSKMDFPLIQKLSSLDGTLESLHCDVRNRMAFGDRPRLIVFPSFPLGRSINLPPPEEGSLGMWLFVMKPPGNLDRGVLVILSSEGPRQTTVFWLKESGEGYEATLLFDTFKKGVISNDTPQQMGTVTTIKFESNNVILLKDWGAPGVGPPEFTRVRRLFRLDLSKDVVTEVFPGAAPRR